LVCGRDPHGSWPVSTVSSSARIGAPWQRASTSTYSSNARGEAVTSPRLGVAGLGAGATATARGGGVARCA
jgi:hypothetical protein